MKTTFASEVSDLIKHGNAIQENGLGTILPTPSQLRKADKHADKMRQESLRIAAKELSGLERRVVDGEVRYYKTAAIYTPAVCRGGTRRWFETRADGDYAI